MGSSGAIPWKAHTRPIGGRRGGPAGPHRRGVPRGRQPSRGANGESDPPLTGHRRALEVSRGIDGRRTSDPARKDARVAHLDERAEREAGRVRGVPTQRWRSRAHVPPVDADGRHRHRDTRRGRSGPFVRRAPQRHRSVLHMVRRAGDGRPRRPGQAGPRGRPGTRRGLGAGGRPGVLGTSPALGAARLGERLVPSLRIGIGAIHRASGPARDPVYPRRPMATAARDTLARDQAHALVRAWDSRPGTLGNLLGRVTPVDQVAAEERVATLQKRSIKKASKLWALDLAIRMMDLTTLEGKDTPGKVRALCAKGIHPKPGDPTIPQRGGDLHLPVADPRGQGRPQGQRRPCRQRRDRLPRGQSFLEIKLAETKRGRGGRRRDRHGHRPRRVPERRLRHGVRRDRGHQGSVRPRPSQGHPRDRRARHVRRGPPGERPRDGRRRRLHQDQHGQGHAGRDTAGHARDARGDPRLREGDRQPSA